MNTNESRATLRNTVILSARADGLMARIYWIFNLFWAVDEYPDKKIFFIWAVNRVCPAGFFDLFEATSELERICCLDPEGLKTLALGVGAGSGLCEDITGKTYSEGNIYIDGDLHLHVQELWKKIGNNYDEREKKRIECLNRLKVKADILSVVEALSKKHSIGPRVVGMHIRGMESHIYRKDKSKLIGLMNEYKEGIRSILSENPSQRFFVASCEEWIEDEFLKEFPSNVFNCPELLHPDHTVGRGPVRSKQETVDGLITVLLLSETNYNDKLRLNGSYSSFTRMPYYLKGKTWPKR